MPDTLKNFAEKLNTLFEHKRKPDGSKYTQEEVVQGTDGVLTRAYLWKLRTGRAKNPGFQIVQALADFFEVDINYFRDDQGQETELIEQATQDKLVGDIAFRSSMLGHEAKLAVLNMIDFILNNRLDEDETQET
jgi:transcriptional regulator with XRE-family HTH domain